MKARYTRSVEEAKRQYSLSGMRRDKELLDYLETRLKRYTL